MAESAIDIVVTAAREAQARGYRALLAARERSGDLPHKCRVFVVTDPHGRRAGSGAATALALQQIRGRGAHALRDRRVLIIHSGGDSRRLPAFAALGKAFAPLPYERPCGELVSIFDLVLNDLSALALAAPPGVIVASGDAVVGVAKERIVCDGPGVTGIAQRGSVERGSRHGVYVADRVERGPHGERVRDFLQKPDARIARASGAIARDGSLLIDTGIVRFSTRAAEALLAGFGVRRGVIGRGLLQAVIDGRARAVDLYDHVLSALVPSLSLQAYRARVGVADDADDRAHFETLFAALHSVPFHLRRSVSDGFLHMGTTRECLALLLDERHSAASERFLPRTSSVRQLHTSAMRVRARRRNAVLVSCLGASLTLEGENLVVGLPPTAKPMHLRRGFGCVALPIDRDAWSTVLFHIDDDPKSLLSENPRWAGRRFRQFCTTGGIGVRCSIEPERATLWEAKLWRVTDRPELEPWMMRGVRAPRSLASAERWSIAELLERVNHERVIDLDRTIARTSMLDDPLGALRRDARRGASWFSERLQPAERARLVTALVTGLPQQEPLVRARALAVAARLAGGRAEPLLRAQAFAAVGEAVAAETVQPREQPRAVLRPDETVWTSAPARIDLAGGWSDTPPICQELGGRVVNLAIDLDHRPPVHAIAKLAERRLITIHSVDLGEHRTISSTEELFAHRDPRDWTALAKAALRLAGIAPPSPRIPLDRWLKHFGGGLSLSMLAAVPKGSGLGTSSILGATVLACLDRVVGRSYSTDELIARTSLLEQMIATRGGWQDQIGGIVPGLKIAESTPGTVQRPTVTSIPLPPDFERELLDRAVLCFTGRRRMARDILERVVDRYLTRDANILAIVEDLRAGATRLAEAARSGDFDCFAHEVNRYWALKVMIDPAATTPEIEAMAAPFARSLAAWTLPGAGAGGFLFFIARSRRAADEIRRRFVHQPPNPLARLVAWSIASQGLRSGSV